MEFLEGTLIKNSFPVRFIVLKNEPYLTRSNSKGAAKLLESFGGSTFWKKSSRREKDHQF
jgi:hypothetical protein